MRFHGIIRWKPKVSMRLTPTIAYYVVYPARKISLATGNYVFRLSS